MATGSPAVTWQTQELGVEGTETCSEVLRAATHLWTSCEVDSQDVSTRLEGVGELAGHAGEGGLVDGGDEQLEAGG